MKRSSNPLSNLFLAAVTIIVTAICFKIAEEAAKAFTPAISHYMGKFAAKVYPPSEANKGSSPPWNTRKPWE